MGWKFKADQPIYLQIVEQIVTDILSGKYQLGEKLPSVRELAYLASVNPNTMQRALSELEAKGLAITQRNSGRYVTTEESAIEDARNARAYELVDEFLSRMCALGFTIEQIKERLENIGGGDNGNGNHT